MSGDLGDLVSWANGSMLVVTVASGSERAGCLVGFHSQCSIEPPRYAVWLSKVNHTYRVAREAEFLGLHFLGHGDHQLAELFGSETGDEVDKFARCRVDLDPHGVPLLDGPSNRVVARRVALIDEGCDHACFIVEPVEVVTAAAAESAEPLRLADVADIEPGHEVS